jgi:tetratricopeptide (TPR) repeat protein
MKTLVARASRTTATFALAFAAVAAWPGEARAQQTAAVDEGRNRFNRGIDLYKEGNFHGALAEFRAAYAAAPSYRIQYNLGQTLFQIQDYAGAVRAFEQYLADGGDKIEPDRRKDLESDIAKLRPRVARLSIVVNAPNADVVIDEEPRGKALKQGVLVSAGRRRISVTASGYQTETRVLDIAGAQHMELKFELKPIVTAAAPLPNEPPASSERPIVMVARSRAPFYVGLVTTAVLAGGAVVMAVVTSKNHADYDKALNVPNDAQAIDSARTATRTTALVADLLGGAAVISAGLAVIAYAVTSGTEPAPTARSTKAWTRTSSARAR